MKLFENDGVLKKVIITGGSGLLGKELIALCERNEIKCVAPTHAECDITNYDQVHDAIANNLDQEYQTILIHAAAMIGAPACAENKMKAFYTNVVGTQHIVDVTSLYNVPVAYISTDYVFDGEHSHYKEEDYVNPVSYYAMTKALAEQNVLGAPFNKVLRVSFCPMQWKHSKAFVDKYTSMVDVKTMAKQVLHSALLYNVYESNILHLGQERTTFYEIAVSLGSKPEPCSVADASLKIPVDTSLDLSKFNELVKKFPIALR